MSQKFGYKILKTTRVMRKVYILNGQPSYILLRLTNMMRRFSVCLDCMGLKTILMTTVLFKLMTVGFYDAYYNHATHSDLKQY